MNPSGGMAAILLGGLLAWAVVGVPDSGERHELDSARASWIAGEAGLRLIAHADAAALEPERVDPVLEFFLRPVRDRSLAFDLYRAASLTIAFVAFWLLARRLGTSPPWAAATVAAAAVPLLWLERLGHPLWTQFAWLAVLITVLERLAASVTVFRLGTSLVVLVLLRLGSELYFSLALGVLAAFALRFGARSRDHSLAAVILLGTALALLLIASSASMSAPDPMRTLSQAPVRFTLREILEVARFHEVLIVSPLWLAAAAAAVAEPPRRAAMILVLLLIWASFGWYTPTFGPLRFLPPMRLWSWVPGGAVHWIPALLGLGGLIFATLEGARWLSSRSPRLSGAALACAAAVVVWLAPGPADGTGVPMLHPAPPVPADARVLAWPLDPELLARRLADAPDRRYVNLDREVLAELAPFLRAGAMALWSERWWRALATLNVTHLDLLVGGIPSTPPGVLWPPGPDDRLVRVSPEAALRRRRLVRLPVSGWSAASSGLARRELPETAAFDGNRASRWGTGGPQHPGQWLELDLGREIPAVTRVVLDPGRWASDWPRALTVEILDGDGTLHALGEAAATSPGEARIVADFPPQGARRIRLAQNGYHPSLDWSIAEIEVWRQAKP